MWNDPKISYEKLLRSEEFRSVLDALDYLRPDRPIANRIDALAASFVHEANRILIKEKKYVVLITGSPVPLLTYGLHPFKHQYIQFPIERNLEYVAIRIYLFTKYKERKEIIGRLNQILPYIDQIVEVGTPIEQLLNSTPRIEMLPPDVVSNMESLSQARKVSEEIIEDMSQILMAIAKDIRVSIEARVRFIQSSMPASLFALFKEDEPALASHIRDTLKTIEKVFLQLEKEIGVIDFADKAAILGKQLEFQVSSVLSKLLSAMGFEVKAGVAYNFADLPYVTEKPGIVATKDGSVFIFCLKILLDEKSTPWSAGNEIKATSDILKATNFFGTSAVNPVLVLINAKSRKEIEDFSRAIGVRIITLTDQQIEKILNNKDLREARELGRELLRLEQ